MCNSFGGGMGNCAERREDKLLSTQNSQKVLAHVKVLTGVFDALVESDSWITDRLRQEAAQSLRELVPQVRDCRSDSALRAYIRLCEATDAYASVPSLYRLGDQFQALEDFLMAMRADLCHDWPGLERDDELSVFVSDISAYLAHSETLVQTA